MIFFNWTYQNKRTLVFNQFSDNSLFVCPHDLFTASPASLGVAKWIIFVAAMGHTDCACHQERWFHQTLR